MNEESSPFPAVPALVRLLMDGEARLALWDGETLRDLSRASDQRLHSLDTLMALPVDEIRGRLEGAEVRALPEIEADYGAGGHPRGVPLQTPVEHPQGGGLQAPVESQEVWAAGVTYLRSREARMEEAAAKDIYAQVYEAERPELFFKAAGWRVVPPGGEVGVRSDSEWDVPEPELAVLSNARGEVVAYSCGNDMSSRSIEGENPLYLPQAKVYDASCSIGPAAVLAWQVDPRNAEIRMSIKRDGQEIFARSANLSEMVRDPAELSAVLHSVYTLPSGAWLLTGTSIVPPASYTVMPGDEVGIGIEGIGELRNVVKRIEHSGAKAPPRIR